MLTSKKQKEQRMKNKIDNNTTIQMTIEVMTKMKNIKQVL